MQSELFEDNLSLICFAHVGTSKLKMARIACSYYRTGSEFIIKVFIEQQVILQNYLHIICR